VNYLDREIRKDLAEHHRETVCFARSQLMSDARMWIYLVWHNTDKPYRISPRQDVSHAEAAGGRRGAGASGAAANPYAEGISHAIVVESHAAARVDGDDQDTGGGILHQPAPNS
jgi:hypothetical protein